MMNQCITINTKKDNIVLKINEDADQKSIIECLKTNKDLKETYFKKNEYLINNLKKISLASKFLYSKRQSWYIKIALHNVKLLQKIKNIIN